MRSICIDIGTTTIKGIVYDDLGRVCRSAERRPKLIAPKPGRREHDPSEILWHVTGLLKELVSHVNTEREELAFISFSCYMHSVILLDEAENPLTGCILWNDSRSGNAVEEAKNNGKGYEIYKNTGTPVHPMSPLYKLIYYKNEEPEIFAKAKRAVSAKEYVLKHACGEWLVDYSLASATGLFNIHTVEWDDLALDYAGLSKDLLSKPVPTHTIIKDLLPEFSAEIGLKQDCPIVIGASDGCLATLGSHGLEPGIAVCTIGTSGALRVVGKKPLLDDKARVFSYILDDGIYVSGGAVNNGCIAYEWLRKILGATEHLDKVFEEKDYNEAGRGLLFLPFLSGERAPYWDADLRAAFLGLRHEHTQDDMLVAGIEGISFAICDVLKVLEAKGKSADVIYANGGFTNSMIWVQILSDITERPIRISDQGDGALFGAFLLGLSATGRIGSFSEAKDYFMVGREFLPQAKVDRQEKFSLYQRAIEANTELLHALAQCENSQNDK